MDHSHFSKCEWSERVVSVFIVELLRNQCEECSPSRGNGIIVTYFNFAYHYECCEYCLKLPQTSPFSKSSAVLLATLAGFP